MKGVRQNDPLAKAAELIQTMYQKWIPFTRSSAAVVLAISGYKPRRQFMDAISLARLAVVHPVLSQRVQSLASQLEFPIRVTEGIRTVAQQNALYAQGRTAPGLVVTNAQGTESNHVLGLAVDVVPVDIQDGQPDWNAQHPSWRRIVQLAPNYGLRDGVSFRDMPHLELLEVPEVPTAEMRQTYIDGGVIAVWGEISLPALA